MSSTNEPIYRPTAEITGPIREEYNPRNPPKAIVRPAISKIIPVIKRIAFFMVCIVLTVIPQI
jgi:hypothetical protein